MVERSSGGGYVYSKCHVKHEPDYHDWSKRAPKLRSSERLYEEEKDQNGTGYADNLRHGDVRFHHI